MRILICHRVFFSGFVSALIICGLGVSGWPVPAAFANAPGELVFDAAPSRVEMITSQTEVDAVEPHPEILYVVTLRVFKVISGLSDAKTVRIGVHSPALSFHLNPFQYKKGNLKKLYRITFKIGADQRAQFVRAEKLSGAEKAVTGARDSGYAAYLEGVELAKDHEFQKAEEVFKSARDSAQFGATDYHSAVAVAQDAQKGVIDPKLARKMIEADNDIMCGRPVDSARKVFQEVVHEYPSYGWAHYAVAYTSIVMQRYGEAVQDLEKAAQLDPANVLFRIGLVMGYFHTRQALQARESLEQAKVVCQKSSDPWCQKDLEKLETGLASFFSKAGV